MAVLRLQITLLAMLLCLAAAPASAQQSVSDVLSFLVTNQAVATDDFVKDREAAAATRDTIARFLQIELSTLPITSSTGGFIYRFNPVMGTMERVSDDFGPFFVERSLTSGRGQVSFGLSYRHSQFDTLDGRSLVDGTLVTIANRLGTESQPFDIETLSLHVDAHTYTLFGNYGVTDRLDVGAAVPIVTLRLSGERVNNYRGTVFQQATGSAFATGLADVALRAKYGIVQKGVAGIATKVDVRLPTGDERQLLGAGQTAVHVSAVASVGTDRIGSHFEAGVGRGGVSDSVEWSGALVVAATPHLNFVGELLGRRLGALSRITDVTAPHPQLPNVATTRLLPGAAGINTLLGVAGVKWNVARTWLLNANVLFPLTESGLTGRPTPSIAVDYSFDRIRR